MTSHQTADRPAVVAAPTPSRKASILDQAIAETMARRFDVDAYHVMNRADDGLVTDEIMNGAKSAVFIYDFKISGTTVQGISVVGAAHLASEYGGIKHRIIATIEKRNGMLISTSYPQDGQPMKMQADTARGFEDDDDFFKAVVEVTNIKNGNSVQMEKTETLHGTKSDGGTFIRPHFDVIAQSKAYRNAVLRVIPQDVQRRFMAECLKQGKSKDIGADVLDQKRRGIIAFTAKHGIPVTREAVYALGMDQIEGLGQAAASGDGAKAAFVQACIGLGLIAGDGTATQEQGQQTGKQTTETKPKTTREPKKAAAGTQDKGTVETGGDQRPMPPADGDPDFG